jgi:hypothetical protein
MIIGGIAVIARGVPRLTRDIDATVAGAGTDLEELAGVLRRHQFVARIEDAVRFAQQNHVLLLRHAPSGVEVDLSVAWLPFELEAIAASDVVRIHGTPVPVARAEDLVIYKVAAWRPQDQQDIERLIAIHGAHMDLRRVRAAVRDLATTLDEPQRVEEFEKILTRARAPRSGEAAAWPPEGAGPSTRNRETAPRAPATVKKTTRKRPSSRVAAQRAAAPDSASSRATRGRTRRG